jgi:hypothetical protein
LSGRAYEVRCAIDDFQHVDIRFGPTVAKVRGRAVSDIQDAWPDISYQHVKVRFVGERKTPSELAQEQVDAFNALAPVGTWVLVRQIIGSEDLQGAFCTRVQEPGAFVARAGYAVVKVPGDCCAIECVTAIRWEGEA